MPYVNLSQNLYQGHRNRPCIIKKINLASNRAKHDGYGINNELNPYNYVYLYLILIYNRPAHIM